MPNLILVHQRTKQDPADYAEIARRMAARAPDIAMPFVVKKDRSPASETVRTFSAKPGSHKGSPNPSSVIN